MELGQAKKIFFITKKSENVTVRTLETYEDVVNKFFDYLFNKTILDISQVDSWIGYTKLDRFNKVM